ncbi:hypothetical protein GC163_21565 [bacterium]|nr:hypothetical protein [bacterium]
MTAPRNPYQPRPWPKLTEPVTIVWKRPAAYRLCSYGELQTQARNERWFVRRIVFIVMALLVSYPLSLIFWQETCQVHPGPVTNLLAEGLAVLAIPLDLANFLVPGLERWRNAYALQCQRWLKSSPEGILPLFSAGLVSLSLFWLFMLYAVSPMGSWLLARLCGFDHMDLFTSQMGFVYRPLEWLVDRSQTLKRFYQIYFEVQEELD